MIRRSYPLDHAQCGLILFDLAQQFISIRTSGKLPGLLARYPDLFAQAIGLRCFAHYRSARLARSMQCTRRKPGGFQKPKTFLDRSEPPTSGCRW